MSGQVALDENGQLVGADDFAAQARQALRNLANVLKRLGATWGDVVRFNWYLVDTSELPILRQIRDEFILPALDGRPAPASTLIQVAGLFRPDCLIEVDAVVAIP